MPKLRKELRFLDLSDYGRPAAVIIACSLKNSRLTPIHLTILFTISGLTAVYFIIENYYVLAGLMIILKSILDAADGELSRVKNNPSYTGRYLDSIFDMIINFSIITSIAYKTNESFYYWFIAFLGLQLQGTLYNYYYVILRNNSSGGDDTSRIFELEPPKALNGESQQSVNFLFKIYKTLYGFFDKIIYKLDKSAVRSKNFPNWFMTLVSCYGLGFQLMIISLMLSFNLIGDIIPFFIFYTSLMILIIFIRKSFLNNSGFNYFIIKTGDR